MSEKFSSGAKTPKQSIKQIILALFPLGKKCLYFGMDKIYHDWYSMVGMVSTVSFFITLFNAGMGKCLIELSYLKCNCINSAPWNIVIQAMKH